MKKKYVMKSIKVYNYNDGVATEQLKAKNRPVKKTIVN